MSTLYERIADLCDQRGIKGYRLCKDIEIQPSILTDLKNGRKKGISTDYAVRIATYFGVSVDYLLGNEAETEQKKIASPKGSEFLEKYSLLTPQNQALIDQMLDQLSKAQSVE